mmetsp:Transcript_9484/g.29472  ORF Transcript_9484/g.29472 Transcript_9484/m.29472 type:complete len:383 (-) Transcript_9484:858-2006(-)
MLLPGGPCTLLRSAISTPARPLVVPYRGVFLREEASVHAQAIGLLASRRFPPLLLSAILATVRPTHRRTALVVPSVLLLLLPPPSNGGASSAEEVSAVAFGGSATTAGRIGALTAGLRVHRPRCLSFVNNCLLRVWIVAVLLRLLLLLVLELLLLPPLALRASALLLLTELGLPRTPLLPLPLLCPPMPPVPAENLIFSMAPAWQDPFVSGHFASGTSSTETGAGARQLARPASRQAARRPCSCSRSAEETSSKPSRLSDVASSLAECRAWLFFAWPVLALVIWASILRNSRRLIRRSERLTAALAAFSVSAADSRIWCVRSERSNWKVWERWSLRVPHWRARPSTNSSWERHPLLSTSSTERMWKWSSGRPTPKSRNSPCI